MDSLCAHMTMLENDGPTELQCKTAWKARIVPSLYFIHTFVFPQNQRSCRKCINEDICNTVVHGVPESPRFSDTLIRTGGLI